MILGKKETLLEQKQYTTLIGEYNIYSIQRSLFSDKFLWYQLYHLFHYISCVNNSILMFGVTLLQECGFTPSVISYGCLINLYTKVIFSVSGCTD